MAKDCFGIEAQEGDHIMYSQGNSGAKVWQQAIVTTVTAKSVMFSGLDGGMYPSKTILRRGSGSFVINLSKR